MGLPGLKPIAFQGFDHSWGALEESLFPLFCFCVFAYLLASSSFKVHSHP